MAPQLPSTRVVDLTYDYDWLANMLEWSDDASAFYERSIGIIHNGADEPALRPSALYFATNIREAPATWTPSVDHGGYVSVDYGDGGNVEAFTVRAQCFDRSAAEICADADGTALQRTNNLDANCACQREQHYQYRYDELNRLLEARRYDRAGSGNWGLQVRQRYQYDAGNGRTHKSTLADADAAPLEPAERTSLYVYPGDFERRGLVPNQGGLRYDANIELGTEAQYVVSDARLVWKSADPYAGLLTREQRLTYTVTDLIKSTSAVVDLMSGELVEHTTFYPNGARETHRATDAIALQLEPKGFTGKEADEEVGLVYFGERYLIPRLGRWSTPDPLHIHATGGGEALNSYHYVSGNLLQARDPLGLYGDVGHYYVTVLAAQAAGYSKEDAIEIAAQTQRADEVAETDAKTLAMRAIPGGWGAENRMYVIQRGLHGLTGGDSRIVRETAFDRVRSARDSVELGLALHLLGDSYAHETDRRMASTGIGHAWATFGGVALMGLSRGIAKDDLFNPDQITHDPEKFRQYATTEMELLAERNGLEGEELARAREKFQEQLDEVLSSRSERVQRRVARRLAGIGEDGYRPEKQTLRDAVSREDRIFQRRAFDFALKNEARFSPQVDE